MSFARICSFAILLPYTIQYLAPDSSSYDEVKFGVGTGQYGYADCSGVHTRSFTDAGATITHKFEAPFRIGAHAFVGGIGDDGTTSAFIYPDLALDFKYFSFGTTGIRVGNLDEAYVELAALDQPPPFSGKGALRFGVGLGSIPPFSRFWIGANGIPYSNLGVATQIEFPVQENQYMFLNGRYGNYENVPEYGVSVGLRIRY
jgi:hypothetical protein